MKYLSENARAVLKKYLAEHPNIVADRDYYPFKITEEWGECLQAYLLLTKRGRDKGKTEEEMKRALEDEMADVLGFLLIFAENEGVDLERALQNKWFKRLKDE